MRLVRKLSRKQAAHFLPFDHKNLEWLEKELGPKKRTTANKRTDRRFCHRRITRECKVLKEMRLIKSIDQYAASKDCKYGRNTVGFIENGRVTLTEKKIRHMVETYGFTMEMFQKLLKQPLSRHEIIEHSQEILIKLDENKLRVIFPMLQSMANN